MINNMANQSRNNIKDDGANTNLYIARLPEWVTDEWLRTQFERFGMVVSCKVLHEGPNGPRGVGFVQYTQHGVLSILCQA